jgi:hypothetical protein
VTTQLRRILTALAMLAGLLALSPATAALASNPGKTVTFHDRVDTFTDVVPCTTIPVTVTTVSNGVEHFQVTTMPDGSVRAQGTFTQTGTFQAVRLDGSGITYSGHFTAWDGFTATNPVFGPDGEIVSADTFVDTSTFNIHGTGSDGSVISEHVNSHIGMNPVGHTSEFFKDSCAA